MRVAHFLTTKLLIQCLSNFYFYAHLEEKKIFAPLPNACKYSPPKLGPEVSRNVMNKKHTHTQNFKKNKNKLTRRVIASISSNDPITYLDKLGMMYGRIAERRRALHFEKRCFNLIIPSFFFLKETSPQAVASNAAPHLFERRSVRVQGYG